MKIALLVVATLGQILGGKPQPLTTPYQTERAWAIGETAADIAERRGMDEVAAFLR
jgi:hypothetical protein